MKQKGFTLVELITVLVIISVLAVFAMQAYAGYVEDAEREKTSRTFDDAMRYMEHRFEATELRLQQGLAPADAMPADAAALIAELYGSFPDATNSVGEPLFSVSTTHAANGSILLGPFNVNPTGTAGNPGVPVFNVEFSQPAFLGLPQRCYQRDYEDDAATITEGACP